MNFCATRYATLYNTTGGEVTTTVSVGPIVVHMMYLSSNNTSAEQIVTCYEGDGTTVLFRGNIYTLGSSSNPFEGPVLLDKGLCIVADAGIIWSVGYSDSGS